MLPIVALFKIFFVVSLVISILLFVPVNVLSIDEFKVLPINKVILLKIGFNKSIIELEPWLKYVNILYPINAKNVNNIIKNIVFDCETAIFGDSLIVLKFLLNSGIIVAADKIGVVIFFCVIDCFLDADCCLDNDWIGDIDSIDVCDFDLGNDCV